ncbi:MAG: hypothetical protein EU548_05025 [Promethearchaeota archaeon]|nr:MAG: hypothetical protein EU548_05025 [Candidatus Lokiarchaeota archaeon]
MTDKNFNVVTGILFFIASMLHGFMPLDVIQPTPLEGSITWFLSKPISVLLFTLKGTFDIIRGVFGIIFLFLGFGTIFRSLNTFGFDYMSMIEDRDI